MSTIRKQSIISSGLVYIGFGLGFLYTILFARGFTPGQYGLTQMFLALGSIMYYVANLGMPSFIYKFYPYYRDHLSPRRNDMLTWALIVTIIGFLFVVAGGLIFKGFVIRKFSNESPGVVRYYAWMFPYGFGLSLYSLLEAYAWQLKRSVLTNYFREVQLRVFNILLVVLYYVGWLKGFDAFVKLYALGYLVLAICLITYLVLHRELHFTMRVSRVTRRFFRKIVAQASLVWSGQLLYNVSLFFAQIVIAAVVPGGLKYVGIYSLAQIVASLIQAPQRGIIAASIGPLSQAWKNKDYARIDRIYKRSSINQLIFSVGMFILIWLNFRDGVLTFHLKLDYLEAQRPFLFIGLMKIIDMGTGVTNQIIGTSTFWRFDFFTGVILTALTLPVNYFLTKTVGFTGPAIADLVTFTLYNAIRWIFLYRKFDMQPFDLKSVYTLLLGGIGWWLCEFLFGRAGGFGSIVLRSLVFIAIFGGGTLALRLSDDVGPVWMTVKKRLAAAMGRPRKV
ncbi:MAG TPA: lipopolysaccharide biosynthesis protein [Puia sp.]|nr:lipopolysaccharide biosynthesis protein [Puia sp.]